MTYKTMQGREIDLDQLRARNESTLAVGNVRVNARGDEIGPGGQIIRKREEVMAEYHAVHPDAVQGKSIKKAETKTQPVVEKAPENSGIDDEFDEPTK
jgi:hypothetical protein